MTNKLNLGGCVALILLTLCSASRADSFNFTFGAVSGTTTDLNVAQGSGVISVPIYLQESGFGSGVPLLSTNGLSNIVFRVDLTASSGTPPASIDSATQYSDDLSVDPGTIATTAGSASFFPFISDPAGAVGSLDPITNVFRVQLGTLNIALGGVGTTTFHIELDPSFSSPNTILTDSTSSLDYDLRGGADLNVNVQAAMPQAATPIPSPVAGGLVLLSSAGGVRVLTRKHAARR